MNKLLLAFLALTLAQAQEVVLNESGYRWVRRAVLVPRSDFNLKTATALTEDFLKTQPEDTIVQFLVVTERRQASRILRPPRLEPFDAWLKSREYEMKMDWTMAETTALGGGAVMRFRMGHDAPSRHVMRGLDPMLLQIDGRQYEIIHIWLFPPARDHGYWPKFFIRSSSAVDTDTAERVTNRLRGLLGGRPMPMTVYFGTDAWFYNRSDFPAYCALCGDERLPTKEELVSSWTWCDGVTVSPAGITCYPKVR